MAHIIENFQNLTIGVFLHNYQSFRRVSFLMPKGNTGVSKYYGCGTLPIKRLGSMPSVVLYLYSF